MSFIKIKRFIKPAAATVIMIFALAAIAWWPGGLGPNHKVSADSSIGFSDIWVGTVSPGSGHIGVDLWWPSNGSAYNPCQNDADAFYGACALSNAATTSYYKVQNYTPTSSDFAYGVFLDNQNTNTCKTSSWCNNKSASSFNHGWARLASDASLEIYPHTSGGQYDPSNNTIGGLRIQVQFPTIANGGRYSQDVGNVTLPQMGQNGVAKLNGFVTNNGSAVSANRVQFDVFQRDSTWTTSTGYPTAGFTTVKTNSDGYYTTGALPAGSYKIYITDTQTGHKIILDGVDIVHSYDRLDFKLDQHCFGYSSSVCTDPAS